MSKSAHKNPYRDGSKYNTLFGFLKSKQVVTRKDMLSFATEKMGMKDSEAMSAVAVMLSPREADGRGDCRGNLSAHGEVYFLDPIKKPGEPKKFRLRWRAEPIERLVRGINGEVKPKTRAKAKAKAVESVA